MTEIQKPNTLSVVNADIGWLNFSGNERQYNAAGDRNFALFMDQDSAEGLARLGWNVKMTKKKDHHPDDWEPQYFLPVTVSFKHIPPKVVMVTRTKKTILSEDVVGILDSADIVRADVAINPSVWNVNGKTGVKAYLRTAYLTIQEEDFESEYDHIPWGGGGAQPEEYND